MRIRTLVIVLVTTMALAGEEPSTNQKPTAPNDNGR